MDNNLKLSEWAICEDWTKKNYDAKDTRIKYDSMRINLFY